MKRFVLASVGATIVGILGAAVTVTAAAGMITAKDSGNFVLGDVIGYPTGHTFAPRIAAGSTVDTLIVRVPPGGDFGWHYHNEAVAVAVTAGALTLYDPASCASQTVAAGQGFLEEPGAIHLARNEGSTLALLVVTYLGIPAGHAPDVNEPPTYDPCSGVE